VRDAEDRRPLPGGGRGVGVAGCEAEDRAKEGEVAAALHTRRVGGVVGAAGVPGGECGREGVGEERCRVVGVEFGQHAAFFWTLWKR
jgi:hypothetical protein